MRGPRPPQRREHEQTLVQSEVAEIQRARLLAAAVRTVDELGYNHTTVAHITARARVSRRTFYELFANRDECIAAVLDGAVAAVEHQLAQAGIGELLWCERVRRGLWTILCLLDRDRALARLCIVESLHAGAAVQERRERVLSRLADVFDEGRLESTRTAACAPLTAEGLVGAASTIVHARLLPGAQAPLTDLLGELMGIVVLPYLGASAARREQTRPLPAAAAGSEWDLADGTRSGHDPLAGVPMRLTYRTARILEAIAERDGISNRQAGERAGIADQGQTSKLLARLERIGLIENDSDGHAKGEPNAWKLTATGRSVAQSIGGHGRAPDRSAA